MFQIGKNDKSYFDIMPELKKVLTENDIRETGVSDIMYQICQYCYDNNVIMRDRKEFNDLLHTAKLFCLKNNLTSEQALYFTLGRLHDFLIDAVI